MSNWTLFSNHGHVLVCLARDPNARLRDVAADVGITERAVQKIVRDLQQGEVVNVSKQGRRNCYCIVETRHLRHDLEAHCTLADLMDLIVESSVQNEPAVLPRSIEPRPVRFNLEDLRPKPARKPKTVVSKAEELKSAESKSEELGARQPKPVKPKQTKPAPTKAKRSQSKADEPKASDSPERQQGSLF